MPERRSNKARARINARERSRERNTCLGSAVELRLKGAVLGDGGGRDGRERETEARVATVDTYFNPSHV